MSGRKAMAHETAWSAADQGFAVLAQLVSFTLLGKSLGPGGYGPYIGLFALIGPFFAFTNSGVSLTILEHTVRENEDRLPVIRSAMGVTAVLAAATTPVVVVVAWFFIDSISLLAITAFAIGELLLTSLLVAMISAVMAHDGFIPAAKLRMFSSLVRILVFGGLALGGWLNLETLAMTQLAVVPFVYLFVAARVRRTLGSWPRPGRIRRRHVRSTFVYGTGIATSGIQSEGDKFVLNAANFPADAGRYGAAFRVVQFGLLPINSLVFATHISYLESGRANADLIRRSLRLGGLSLIYGVAVGVLLFVLAPVLPAIFGDEYAETETMIRWLTPVIVLRGVGTFPMNGLLGLGRNRLRTGILSSTALLSAVLYIALIPRYSWGGAVAGTLISETLLFLAGWIALYRCQRTRDTDLERLRPARWAAPKPLDRIA